VVIVQRVVMPVTGAVSWTVLDSDGTPLEPVESYLAYLAALERSPNTQRAYATSLKLWFEFLDRIDRPWAEVGIDDVARFVSWLRAPAGQRRRARRRRRAALGGHGEPSPGGGVRPL
jgi:integrase/recombinase XerD